MAIQKATNSLATKSSNSEKPKLSEYLASAEMKKSLVNSMGEKESQRFVANLCTVVSQNPALASCDFTSLVSVGLLANSLQLPLSSQLGYFYVVPFGDSKNGRTVATGILGYKGYIQLAIRSGQYRDITVLEIKKSEFHKFDPLTGELDVEINDSIDRDEEETVGYYASFELLNGFRKAIYWSKAKMLQHADKYSKAFSLHGDGKKVSYEDYVAGRYQKSDAWRYSSYWYADFDAMAKKTMIRQLISKWGIMSVDMQTAFEYENSHGTDFGELPDFDAAPSFTGSVEQVSEEPAPSDDDVPYDAETGEIKDAKQQSVDDLFGAIDQD